MSNGGGIGVGVSFAPPIDLRNSTVAFNHAEDYGGGVFSEYGGTVTDYGGVSAVSTIFSNNGAGSEGQGPDFFGSVRASSSLFLTNPTGIVTPDPRVTAANSANAPNQFGTDPNLQPLANNGGPTKTHAIPASSPAFGKGDNPLGLISDQRIFFVRDRNPGGAGGVDVGAYNLDFNAVQITKVDDLTEDITVPSGGTIHYTVTITNYTDGDITGAEFTDTPDANTTLVPGSIKVTPIAVDDSYIYAGSDTNLVVTPTGISSGGFTAPGFSSAGVLANDFEPGNAADPLVVNLVTVQPVGPGPHGTLVMNANGGFTYTPNAAAPTDEWQYNNTNSENLDSVTPGFITFEIGCRAAFDPNCRAAGPG